MLGYGKVDGELRAVEQVMFGQTKWYKLCTSCNIHKYFHELFNIIYHYNYNYLLLLLLLLFININYNNYK